MSGDPGHSKFLMNLQQLGTLCKEHGKDALFTDYLLSIPTGNTVAQIKTDQNPSCQHPRTFGREFSQKKHEIPRKDNRNNNETVSGDAKKVRINARDEVCMKGKVEENQSRLCMFCKKNRVHINNHYLKVHKLDINVWVRNLKERNRRNAFICPQCNKDYRNSTAFREHLSNYHNIHLDKNRRRLKKKDAQEQEDMPAKGNNGDRGRVGAGWSVKKITPVQEEGNESNDEEREIQRGVSQGGKVENTKAHKTNHVKMNSVKERCKQCGEFVDVASFDRHAASHAKEREKFPFKTNRAKIRSYFLKDTLKKTGERKESGNLVSHSRFVSDNERINVNQDNLIRNKTNLAGNLVENGVANEHEEHTRLDHESSDETVTPHDVILEKLQAEAVSIDKKLKQHRKLLWKEFFKRMRNEDTVFQAELFKQYVLLYRDM